MSHFVRQLACGLWACSALLVLGAIDYHDGFIWKGLLNNGLPASDSPPLKRD